LVVYADTGTTRNLLPALEGHVSDFDWVDATTIAFVADGGAHTEVGTVQVDGGAPRVVSPAGSIVATAIEGDDSGFMALVLQNRPAS
jgi:hypothetical protein